jgi:hypothetical protein
MYTEVTRDAFEFDYRACSFGTRFDAFSTRHLSPGISAFPYCEYAHNISADSPSPHNACGHDGCHKDDEPSLNTCFRISNFHGLLNSSWYSYAL